MAQKRTPLRVPLVVIAAVIALSWLTGALDRADNALGDAMLRLHAGTRQVPDDLVIVAIDQ